MNKNKKTVERNNRRQRIYKNKKDHKCGECNLCCSYFAIGDKPAHVLCVHHKNGGCDIYDTKPDLCTAYRCVWFSNRNLKDSWRPDRSGLIMTSRGYYEGYEVVTIEEAISGKLGYFNSEVGKWSKSFVCQEMAEWLIGINAIVILSDGKTDETYHKHVGIMDFQAILKWLYAGYDKDQSKQKNELNGLSLKVDDKCVD